MYNCKRSTFCVFINCSHKIITMLNYALTLRTVGLACVQARMTSDSVLCGDLNGQETDVVFIYSLSCNVLMNVALVNRRR